MAMPVQQYQQMVVRKIPRQTMFREKVPESHKFSADRKSGTGKKQFYIAAQSDGKHIRQAFKDFLGYSSAQKDVDGNTTGIFRIIPHELAEPADYLFAERISNLEGDVALGQDENLDPLYDENKVSVEYATFPYKFKTDSEVLPNFEHTLQRYVSIKIDPTGRYEKIPTAQSMKWFTDNVPMSNQAAVILCEADVFITWYQIPLDAIPWTAITNCSGKTDSNNGGARFTFLASSYMGPVLRPAIGSVLSQFVCMTPKITEAYPMADGNLAVDITYYFKFYPYGANRFYRWDQGMFQLAVTNNGQPFFPAANFNTLFWGT